MVRQKSTQFSLKDQLFNRQRVVFLAEQFQSVVESFDAAAFADKVMRRLPALELKERIVLIAETLEEFLDSDFRIACQQILAALPPELDPSKTDDDFGDFILAPLGVFVVRNGLQSDNLKLSLQTLKEITKRFSMEDPIRAFINTHPQETLAELACWSIDPNYHVRRLVSEGTRPRLPWSGRLSVDYRVPLPLLDNLYSDPTRYVTRSVANHLNDIAKFDSVVVLQTLKRWKAEGRQQPAEFEWISRHALRTLIKQGHSPAMRFLGFRPNADVAVSELTLRKSEILPGEAIEFSVTVTAGRDESLVVDYIIDFVKFSGHLSPKVFKAKQLQLKKGESATVSKRHPLRANATTFTLFPGTHQLTIQVNGKPLISQNFELLHGP